MNIFDNDVELFVVDYIERNIYQDIKREIENDNGFGYSVRKLSDFIDELDADTKKRLLGSARAAKKRLKDKESGNENINVTLSREAHEKLKGQAAFYSVTLSQFITNYMNGGIKTAVDEMNDQERASAEHNRRLVMELQQEISVLKLELANHVCKEIENAAPYVTTEEIKRYQELKPLTERRCNALKKDGTRCKNTEHLDCTNGVILCTYHMGILRNSHANTFKLFNGKTL